MYLQDKLMCVFFMMFVAALGVSFRLPEMVATESDDEMGVVFASSAESMRLGDDWVERDFSAVACAALPAQRLPEFGSLRERRAQCAFEDEQAALRALWDKNPTAGVVLER